MTAARREVVLDLSDYRPTPSQARFLASRADRVLFSGGFGSGKTRANVEKALDLACANEGLPGLLVSPTYQHMHRTLLAEIEKAFPKSIIAEHHETKRFIRLINGSLIYYGSADNPDSIDGPTVAWVCGDEIRMWKRSAYDIAVGRVRHGQAKWLQVALTSTPAMGWMYEEFGTPRPGNELITSSTAENARNLSPGYVERLRTTYSPRLARALIDGEFTLPSGAVFEEWSPQRNGVAWEFDPRCRTVLAVDFGVRSPSVLLLQVTPGWHWPAPDGTTLPPESIVVVDELHPDQTPTVRLVEAIKAKWPGIRLDAIYCDPAGQQRDQNSGMPSVFTLEAGLGVKPRFATAEADRWIANGVATVQGLLSPVDGPPRLYVARRLIEQRHRRGVVAMLEGYRYPEARDGRPTSDIPLKDGVLDHCADTLRYGVTGIVRDEGRVPAHLQLVRTYGRPT